MWGHKSSITLALGAWMAVALVIYNHQGSKPPPPPARISHSSPATIRHRLAFHPAAPDSPSRSGQDQGRVHSMLASGPRALATAGSNGRYEDVALEFARAAAAQSQDALFEVRLAELQMSAGQFQSAIASWQRAATKVVGNEAMVGADRRGKELSKPDTQVLEIEILAGLIRAYVAAGEAEKAHKAWSHANERLLTMRSTAAGASWQAVIDLGMAKIHALEPRVLAH